MAILTRTELIKQLVEKTDVDFGNDESSYVSVSSDDLIKYVQLVCNCINCSYSFV